MAIDAMGEDKGVTYEISRKAPEHLSPAWIWAYARARKDVNVEDAKLPVRVAPFLRVVLLRKRAH